MRQIIYWVLNFLILATAFMVIGQCTCNSRQSIDNEVTTINLNGDDEDGPIPMLGSTDEIKHIYDSLLISANDDLATGHFGKAINKLDVLFEGASFLGESEIYKVRDFRSRLDSAMHAQDDEGERAGNASSEGDVRRK